MNSDFTAAGLARRGELTGETRRRIPPVRLVTEEGKVEGKERLLSADTWQPYINRQTKHALLSPGSMLLFDFGCELAGGILLTTGGGGTELFRLRVVFGESVSEALGEPNNDHAIHDTVLDLPPMGTVEFGNTAFRFLKLEVPADAPKPVPLQSVMAVSVMSDLEFTGSFESSDPLLNRIWQVGARTLHLNTGEFIYDGAKRDRLVWMGDLHPEISTACRLWSDWGMVRRSLDFCRDHTPPGEWINGISSYTLWWIICQHDFHRYAGDLAYLKEQRDFLARILEELTPCVGGDGCEAMPGHRFLDWPSSGNDAAVHVGLQALLFQAMTAAAEIARRIGDDTLRERAGELARRLGGYPIRPAGGHKQSAALLALSGLADPATINMGILSDRPFEGLSTFFGYYVLQARALAGDYSGATDVIRRYWGGMLEMGATSFWEDFDLAWCDNAFSIDSLPVAGKRDIHADFGNYCYKSLRHSLCHGWASGPTAWMSEHLLGVTPVEPGFRRVRIEPRLPKLDFARGTVSTPHGLITVEAERVAGKTVCRYELPDGVERVSFSNSSR